MVEPMPSIKSSFFGLTILCYLAGLAIVVFACLLFVCAGENIIVAPHDQLDSVVDNFLLRVKHANDNWIPEMMGGIETSSLGSGYIVTSFLYATLPAVYAYSINLTLIAVIGYTSLFFMLRELDVHPIFCLLFGIGFISLPFYSAYGLNAMGMPLVFLAVIRLWKHSGWKNLLLSVLLVIAFSLWSSVVLSGYFICAVLVISGLFFIVRGGKRRSFGKGLLVLALVMVLVYVFDPTLFTTAKNAGGADNTRAEMVPTHQPFTWSAIWTFFTEGHYHSLSNQKYLFLLIAFSLVMFGLFTLICRLRHITPDGDFARVKNMAAGILSLVAVAFLIAVFYCAFSSRLGIELRLCLPGSFSSFQFDRLYWAYPTIWFCAGGLSAELIAQTALMSVRVFNPGPLAKGFVALMACAAIVVPLGFTERSSLFPNHKSVDANIVAETIVNNYISPEEDESNSLTWKRFYAEDLMGTIRDTIGRDQSNYRVISVGLYPNIAMHSGFYTLDGYKGYYSLNYKHEFRIIIADELAMDEKLRVYFDEWGSRCYAFSHEVGQNYTVPKDSELEIRDLRFNLRQLKKMGGEYIISAVSIADPGRYDLEVVGDFVTDDSYYHLYVYGLGAIETQEQVSGDS